MDVIGYARVVPDAEAKEALNHQRDRIVSYCQQKGLNLINFFEEQVNRDISLSEGRQALKDAIDSLLPGMGLIIVRLNKISGQKSMVIEVCKMISDRQATLVTVDGSNDPSTMQSTLQVTTIKPNRGI